MEGQQGLKAPDLTTGPQICSPTLPWYLHRRVPAAANASHMCRMPRCPLLHPFAPCPAAPPPARWPQVDQGLTLRNFVASTAWCCPSRVSLLTGLFTHNHNITRQGGGAGGGIQDASMSGGP